MLLTYTHLFLRMSVKKKNKIQKYIQFEKHRPRNGPTRMESCPVQNHKAKPTKFGLIKCFT